VGKDQGTKGRKAVAKRILDVGGSMREDDRGREGEDRGVRTGASSEGGDEDGAGLLHQGREDVQGSVSVREEVRVRDGSGKPQAGFIARLNLGCGETKRHGYVNVDISDQVNADLVVDLNVLPWPWEDGSIDEVFTQDCFEHLSPLGRVNGQANIIAVLAEVFRVLKPGGKVEIVVPSTDGPGAWQDPTHVTFWNRNTFLYFLVNSPEIMGGDWYMSEYPKFEIPGDDYGVGDTMPNDLGIIWTVARIRKPLEEK
jgi:SAM-dependent methyltransferase